MPEIYPLHIRIIFQGTVTDPLTATWKDWTETGPLTVTIPHTTLELVQTILVANSNSRAVTVTDVNFTTSSTKIGNAVLAAGPISIPAGSTDFSVNVKFIFATGTEAPSPLDEVTGEVTLMVTEEGS